MAEDRLLTFGEVCDYLGIATCSNDSGKLRVKKSVLRKYSDDRYKLAISVAADGLSDEEREREAFEMDQTNRDSGGRRKDRRKVAR